MKVALFSPPLTYVDWYRFPSLTFGYLSAVLKQAGHECRTFDPRYFGFGKEELIERIVSYRPDVLGVSAMTHEICAGAEIAGQVKVALPTAIVVVGGCHQTALPARTLEEFPIFDYGVVGEGEKTFQELLAFLAGDGPPTAEGIQQIAWQRDKEVFVNPPRPFLTAQELETLPYPNLDDYFPRGVRALRGKRSQYPMFASRGCPFNCAYCMQVLGRKLRRRSSESICDEIEYAILEYGAHTIRFRDELFLLNDRRTREMLELMIKRGLSKKIRWNGQIHIKFVKRDLIELVKRSGCVELGMGVESGDDEILNKVGRGYSVEEAREAVQIIKEVGIPLGTYFILGHPNETRETIKKTVDLAAELNPDLVAVGLMVPYPGTRVYEMARQAESGYRLISENWAEYDKYGGQCLEVGDLSHKELVTTQKRAVLNLYLKNHRFFDLARYVWSRRRAINRLIFRRYSCYLHKDPDRWDKRSGSQTQKGS